MADGKTMQKLQILHADALQRIEFEPLVEPVKGLVVEGLTLLCGASKVGKSWLVIAMCCAVASGRPFLGHETLAGDVLCLALEDSAIRLQSRLNGLGESPTSALQFATSAQKIENGLLDQLEDWVKHASAPRMIVVDTFQKIRVPAPSRANAYAVDYEIMGKLKHFADKHHIALVLVHHLCKNKTSDDPFDRISGSTGLMGAADTSILIDRERGSDDARLSFVGRDVWGDDLSLRMCDGRWTVVGREQIEREGYEENPTVRTIKHLLASSFGGVVKITSEDFRMAISECCGNCPYGTLDATSKAISAVSSDLLRYDQINVERIRIGSKNGLRFTQNNREVG